PDPQRPVRQPGSGASLMAAHPIRRDDGEVDDKRSSPEALRETQGYPHPWQFAPGWRSNLRNGWASNRAGVEHRVGGPLRRQSHGRIVAGVAAGISAKTGIGANIIRTVFVFSAFLGGFGATVYVLAWLFVPPAGEDGNIASRALSDKRGIALAAAAASLLTLILLIASLLHVSWLGSLSWPPVVALAGLVLIWRNASKDEQAVLRRIAEPVLGLSPHAKRRFGLRLIAASVLIVASVSILLSQHYTQTLLRPLGGVAALIA